MQNTSVWQLFIYEILFQRSVPFVEQISCYLVLLLEECVRGGILVYIGIKYIWWFVPFFAEYYDFHIPLCPFLSYSCLFFNLGEFSVLLLLPQ